MTDGNACVNPATLITYFEGISLKIPDIILYDDYTLFGKKLRNYFQLISQCNFGNIHLDPVDLFMFC